MEDDALTITPPRDVRDQREHDAKWSKIELHDRIAQTLAAKMEGGADHLPTRAMFNCADVQDLLQEAIESAHLLEMYRRQARVG